MSDTASSDLTAALEAARALKNGLVADAGCGRDLAPSVVLWRDGREVATVFALSVNRDAGLDAARFAITGYAADAVTLVTDTYMANAAFMTRFERQPDPGELQELASRGLHRDTWDEGLFVTRVTRDGDVTGAGLPYRVEGSSVRWEPASLNLTLKGLVVDDLRASFDLPVFTSDIDRFEIDMVVSVTLADLGFGVGYHPLSDDEAQRMAVLLRAQDRGMSVSIYGPAGEEHFAGEGAPNLASLAARALQPVLEERWETSAAAEQEERAMNRAERRLAKRKGRETY